MDYAFAEKGIDNLHVLEMWRNAVFQGYCVVWGNLVYNQLWNQSEGGTSTALSTYFSVVEKG